ncbi:cAMP-responsive element modulator-like [Tachypleus tridentatus]|uniref:cAMP-responsive element modulator-like n=1 Tax=Tachypleus tridentatus TaxID=6853 RepID=UPI003FD118AC
MPVLKRMIGIAKQTEDRSTEEDSQEAIFHTNRLVQSLPVVEPQYHASTGLLKVIPASTLQLKTPMEESGLQEIQAITMTSSEGGKVLHYAQGSEGQFFVPELQTYQISTASSSPNCGLPHDVFLAAAPDVKSQEYVPEEVSRKRELRLQKNREAAKECRRKKKEYIKCLEDRVSVLENQNKALIEELKSLKQLYCQKNE